MDQQVVAIAGVGNLGKYACEELLADDRFDVVVLTRSVCEPISLLRRKHFAVAKTEFRIAFLTRYCGPDQQMGHGS